LTQSAAPYHRYSTDTGGHRPIPFSASTSQTRVIRYEGGRRRVCPPVSPLPRLCSNMCSRPCLRIPTRYKKGGTDRPVPPAASYYLQLLPTISVPSCSDSKSRGSNAVRVRPPPPAPETTKPAKAGFLIWCSQGGRTGFGRRRTGGRARPKVAHSGNMPAFDPRCIRSSFVALLAPYR